MQQENHKLPRAFAMATNDPLEPGVYCITRIFRVEEIFAIFANLDFARNFPPAK